MTHEPAKDLAESIRRSLPMERLDLLHALLGEGACRQIGIYAYPPGFKLSVVIPVFNEERWIRELVQRVRSVPIPKELVIVDDGSSEFWRRSPQIRTAHFNGKRMVLRPPPGLLGRDGAVRELTWERIAPSP